MDIGFYFGVMKIFWNEMVANIVGVMNYLLLNGWLILLIEFHLKIFLNCQNPKRCISSIILKAYYFEIIALCLSICMFLT